MICTLQKRVLVTSNRGTAVVVRNVLGCLTRTTILGAAAVVPPGAPASPDIHLEYIIRGGRVLAPARGRNKAGKHVGTGPFGFAREPRALRCHGLGMRERETNSEDKQQSPYPIRVILLNAEAESYTYHDIPCWCISRRRGLHMVIPTAAPKEGAVERCVRSLGKTGGGRRNQGEGPFVRLMFASKNKIKQMLQSRTKKRHTAHKEPYQRACYTASMILRDTNVSFSCKHVECT